MQQAVCVRRNKTEKTPPNPAALKTHHEIHIGPATATTSRRRATKHVPRVSPYSPASIDPGFVEIGLVQLSQSVKTTNVIRHATKHVPRVSPYSPASIDPGFVEIDLVQLSQSVKTTNLTHTHRQTDRQTIKDTVAVAKTSDS